MVSDLQARGGKPVCSTIAAILLQFRVFCHTYYMGMIEQTH